MHLLIPFAWALSAPGSADAGAPRRPELPALKALLARLTEVHRDAGDEWSFQPPHERALAHALGWPAADAQPWAARHAPLDGIDPADAPWGWVTPVHWHLGTDQVSQLDPAELKLDGAASRGVFDALQELFVSAGYGLHYGAPLRWYLTHESLGGLVTASLDRVSGRNVDAWLGTDPAARRIRRLQSEAQMLLYTHPLNEQREGDGLLPVNSFWLSGCGVARPATAAAPTVDNRLRTPALAGDWAAWMQAWQQLDAGPVAELLAASRAGQAMRLTLCGERTSATWAGATPGLGQRLRGLFTQPAVWPLLESL
jgi:hypothetical protein